MPKDITVYLDNHPGTLAALAEALGKADVNMYAMCGFPVRGKGLIHILAENARAARRALREAGISTRGERDVLMMEVEDRPGEAARICRRIADAGANIDLVYLATRTRLVIGVDDLEKAKRALLQDTHSQRSSRPR